MYGFVNFALEQLVLRNFGEEIWSKIKKEAGVEIEGNFMIRVIYSDDLTYNLVNAANKVLNLPAPAILEKFGQFFFEFCVESGYDKILSVLGSSTKDFLQNLDALHDHLSTIYPGMKAPSFRCTENKDGTFVLHYYSDRPGLEFIVIGLVKTVSSRLHNAEVECKVIKSKGEDNCDHVQFLIIEKDKENKDQNVELNNLKLNLQKHLKISTGKPMLTQKAFCKAFPFHVIFDKQMQVKQCGSSISRLIPQIQEKDCNITSIFDIVRPHINFDFTAIKAHVMSVFVLTNKLGVLDVRRNKNKTTETADSSANEILTRFKGQMVYLKEKGLMLFQCSPCVMSVDDLFKRGLCISDIPLHDSNRELMLINEHWSEEFELTQSLEILTDKLQQATKELESEKKKTDKLLYECLPPSIAQQLRQEKEVVPARYEMVSLMFCGIKDFNIYCAKHANNSQQIVNLLNTVFTQLDQKVQNYKEIYKVETIGDKYMAVCGLPEKVENNALYICRVALDIIEITSYICELIKEEIVITVGINSGEIVTGVIGKRMPRYCLFGDTVNLTSRCETTGIKGKINVSEFAYDNLKNSNHIDPTFQFDFRGEVTMKGKPRPIKMWLLSRKPTNKCICPFSN